MKMKKKTDLQLKQLRKFRIQSTIVVSFFELNRILQQKREHEIQIFKIQMRKQYKNQKKKSQLSNRER